MNNAFTEIIGHRLRSIEILHDFLVVEIDGGYVINIFNKTNISLSPALVENGIITGVHHSRDSIGIEIGAGAGVITIGLRDDDFRGPEVCTLKTPDQIYVDRGVE